MKRVKDEEKATMGPMFPRLHVNDAEKGGPRAPPRNKMALYEQLSIPSQRFSQSVIPFTPCNPFANSVPHRSQSNGNERSMFSSHQQLPKLIPDKQHSQYSNVSCSLTQINQRKTLNEEDFIVPVLVQTRPFRERVKNADDPPVISRSLECSNFTGSSAIDHISKQERESKREESLTCESELIKVVSNSSINEKTQDRRAETSFSLSCELGNITCNCASSPKTCERELCNESQPAGGDHCVVSLVERSSMRSLPVKDGNTLHHPSNDQNHVLQEMEKMNRIDGVTKAPVLNAVLELNITPDDVVGMIGQKHFWKARRAITNQQRVFATQIFELHRLIKVQKGMAVSTNARECIASSTKAVTPAPAPAPAPKDLQSDYYQRSVKEHRTASNRESTLENTTQKIQFHKPSLPVVQPNKPLSGHRPSSQSVSSDLYPQWWGYTQPQGQHQWLVPVMSPSEGLVYKPYPGHVLSGPAYPGYHLLGSNQMISNFSSQPQFQLQPHSYFSSHGMPTMNTMVSSSSVEQSNHPPDMPGQLSSKEVHMCQKGTTLPDVNIEDTEVQGSTASSTNERQQEGVIVKGRNVLPLIPRSRASCTELGHPRQEHMPPQVMKASCAELGHPRQEHMPPQVIKASCTELGHSRPEHMPPQVIKAVPHHSKSATESATRIFKSILEERKQLGYL